MTEKLRPPPERLLAISQELNRQTNEAAALVLETERFLVEDCSLGIQARVPFEKVEDGFGGESEAFLSFERVEGKFRFAVLEVEYFQGERQGEQVFFWGSCSRQKKLASIAVLPELLRKLADLAVEQVTKTDGILSSVRDQLLAMKAKGGKK